MFSIQVLFDSSGSSGYVVCIVFDSNVSLLARSLWGDNRNGAWAEMEGWEFAPAPKEYMACGWHLLAKSPLPTYIILIPGHVTPTLLRH